MHRQAEYSGDYNELLYLRARYYAPSSARFLTKDTWTGDANQPMSYNRWIYVVSNPINVTDPSGLNPNCRHPYGSFCAYQRLMEIASQEPGLNALIRLFDDSELYYSWGNWAGRTSIARMNWILMSTRGSGAGGGPEYAPGLPNNLRYAAYENEVLDDALVCGFLPFQFGIDLSGENSFAAEFQDQGFYDRPWNSSGHVTTQVQHFLSAVALSAPYNAVNIRYFDLEHGIKTIIGHEKLSDRISTEEEQMNATTDADLERWYRAVNADTNGDIATRDAQLWAILSFGSNVDFGGVDPRREGNSLQDLRLSLKGYRFFLWVKANGSTHPSSAASWLRLNLQGK